MPSVTQSHLVKMSGASSDRFTYLWAHTTATTKGNNQTQKHLILLILNTAILMFCLFFLLVKTDEIQLILASAVIPMPGACVLPTTTSRGSADAADGSGRGSTQPRRKFKGESRVQVTQGHTGVSRCECLRSGNYDRKVGGSNPLCGYGWACLSLCSLFRLLSKTI